MKYTQEAIYNNMFDFQKRGMDVESIQIVQERKTCLYCEALLFGNFKIRFEVGLTPTGRIKKNSVRFS